MYRFITILGILLIIISIPVLVITMTATDDDSELSQVFESIACNATEKLVINRSMSFDEDGSSINLYCELEPGQRRDVTITFVLITIIIFMIPFGLGMFFTIWGAFRLQQQSTARIYGRIG